MDVATRKRVISSNLDGPAAKVQAALQAPEPPNGFADVLFVNLLNALNMTEPSGRLSLIEDMIFRLKWLKKYYDQNEPPNTSSKSPVGSPRQPEPHKPLDHQNMRRFIEKEKDNLQNISKLIGVAAQGPPLMPGPPPMQPPRIIPPTPEPKPEAKKSPTPINTIAAALAPPPPAPAPVLTPAPAPVAPVAPIPVPPAALTPKVKKPEKKAPSPPPQLQFPFNPAKAEEMILDLQEKQRKLLNYISAAHGGKVTDEVLHDYLRHPYVLLKENGQTRKQPNPFYHLMAQNGQSMRMMPPIPPAVIMRPPESSKPTTPIPAPPVLLPQVDLPMKKDVKMEVSPPPDKCSPPPHLPLQVPLLPAQFDPAKPFVMPVTRECNQWSVVSMALPLRLLCRCYQTPCRCSQ
ncbi:hypothetical protein CAEBREN_24010 [Caenorhabditis brenneri]|uniref:Uncharacterized protein n=1 Tax=Caenorhabditis brenneri TaxID=135651 RepID=G0MA38_CAEBE|nr:hypothetical protein CAEBREN_24010 [Caenorhabditis brenneri]